MTVCTRRIIGGAIILGSLLAMFWWGFHFGVFGKKIHLSLPFFGFFAWIALGIFGMGYAVGGVRAGFTSTGRFLLLGGGAILLGVAMGNYR